MNKYSEKRCNKMLQELQETKYPRMLSSIGFHTFTMFLLLTFSEALKLYRDFQNCAAVRVRPYDHDKRSPNAMPKGYIVEYLEKGIGIRWHIRFNSEVKEYSSMTFNHSYQKEHKPYSVRVTINPKILSGMKDYLSAANADSLDQVEDNYNVKAAEISPILGKFEDYRPNQVDYCFNFDPLEISMGCNVDRLFTLIRRGKIPTHFTEAEGEYCDKSKRFKPYKDDFRLKCKSMTISCYRKYAQLKKRFPDCPDIELSRNVIRFEVKCKYSKIYSMSKSIKKTMLDDLTYDDFIEEVRFGGVVNPTKNLLCDTFTEKIICKYLYEIIRKGDYFTLEGARWMVKSYNFRQDKETRLLNTLNLVNEHRGIAKTLSKLQGNKLSDVKRSLKDLDVIFVNPVTIPRKWGISHIPNPMRAYNDSMYACIFFEPERLFIKRVEEYLAK